MVNLVALGMFLSIAFGIVFPQIATFKPLIPWLLGGLLFTSFLQVDLKSLGRVKKGFPLIPLAFSMGLAAIAWFMTSWLDPQLRLGLVIALIVPSGISNPIVVSFFDGDVGLATYNSVIGNLLSPFYIPVFLGSLGAKLDVDLLSQILPKIALLVFTPFILSRIYLKVQKVPSFMEEAKSLLFFPTLALAVASAAQTGEFFKHISLSPLVFTLTAACFAAGFVFTRDRKLAKTYAVAFGHKNSGLGIWLTLTFMSNLAVVPLVYYIISHHVINSILITRR